MRVWKSQWYCEEVMENIMRVNIKPNITSVFGKGRFGKIITPLDYNIMLAIVVLSTLLIKVYF